MTAAHRGEKALIVPTLINTRNGERKGQRPRAMDSSRPLNTITAIGSQGAVVAGFLARTDMHQSHSRCAYEAGEPLVAAFLARWGDVETQDGLVTLQVGPERFALVDIGMRMLEPRELARAQGFADSYVLTGTRSEQVARIGNSVPPQVVEAVVRAQFAGRRRRGGTTRHVVAAK